MLLHNNNINIVELAAQPYTDTAAPAVETDTVLQAQRPVQIPQERPRRENPLIAAVRARMDLKQSVKDTAEEIAARASIYGVAQVSYRFLLPKTHACKQTLINHVKILESKGVLKVIRQKIAGKLVHERNVYKFILPYRWPTPSNGTHRASQNFGRKFPVQEEGGKNASLQEQITGLQRGLRVANWTPGSEMYASTMEVIAQLTALLPEGGRTSG
jgi:hypothetical protein